MLNWNKIPNNVWNSSFSAAQSNYIMQDCVVVGKNFKLEAELSNSGYFQSFVTILFIVSGTVLPLKLKCKAFGILLFCISLFSVIR